MLFAKRLETMNRSEIKKYYTEKFSKFGATARGVDWEDENSQRLRFRILSEIGDLQGASVLDVGCGNGEMLQWFSRQGLRVAYTGIDMADSMIQFAQKRYGDKGTFLQGDILEAELKPVDYCFASGTFHVKGAAGHEEWFAYVKDALTRMFNLSRRGMAVNFMTSFVDYREDHLFYLSPYDLLHFSMSELTRSITLRHDYPLWEYAAYFYRL